MTCKRSRCIIANPTFNQHFNDADYITLSCWFVDPQANVVPGIPETAICVQVIAALYILQFAIVIALCCALHRSASRVIHRSEWFLYSSFWFQNISLHCTKFQVDNKRDNYKTTNVYFNGATPAGETSIITSQPLTEHVKAPELSQANGNPKLYSGWNGKTTIAISNSTPLGCCICEWTQGKRLE